MAIPYTPSLADALGLDYTGITCNDPGVLAFTAANPDRIDAKFFLKPIQDQMLWVTNAISEIGPTLTIDNFTIELNESDDIAVVSSNICDGTTIIADSNLLEVNPNLVLATNLSVPQLTLTGTSSSGSLALATNNNVSTSSFTACPTGNSPSTVNCWINTNRFLYMNPQCIAFFGHDSGTPSGRGF